jgi:PAS domain S-box-containing protein
MMGDAHLPNAPPRRVLIVEDEGIVALDIEMNLLDLGFEVCGLAASGPEAIEKGSKERPDLVLMDIRIQGPFDGIQTAERLRREQDLPIIYLTALGDEETVRRAKQTEPLAMLVKPVNKAELRSAVEIALYKHDTQKRLRERERWLTTTLRAIADAIISVDLKQRVLFMNPMAESLTNVSADAAVGRALESVLHLVDAKGNPLAECPMDQALREMRAVRIPEIALRNPADGTLRPTRVSAAPVRDGERTLGAVMILQDISQQKRLRLAEREVETERMRSEQAEAAVQQRDEFIAVASHELRSPVTALQLKLSGIRRKLRRLSAGEELVSRLDRAIQHTDRIGQLVERLLDVSRMVTGSLELARDWVDLTPLVRDVVEAFDEQAATMGCVVRVRTSGEAIGNWDGLRVRQVVVNLLSNALKFGRGRPVEVTVESGDRNVRLTIADHGIGISPEDVHRIFGRFERAASIRHYGGMGLGLFIARHLIQAQGGAITASPTPGGGATFVVELPRELAGTRPNEFPGEHRT